MKANILVAILVVLIIVAGTAGTYAGYSLQPKNQEQNKTATQTVTGTGQAQTSACSTANSSAALTAVSLAFTGESGVDSAYYIAQALGFFKQQGLSVTQQVVSPTVLFDGLVSGQIDFGMNGPAGALQVYLQGENVDVLMDNFVNPGTSGIVVRSNLVTSGQVTTIASLSGMKVGVLAAPSAPWYIAQLYSQYFNVNWTQVPFASYTLMIAAFDTGQIAAAVALNGKNTAQFAASGPGVILLDPSTVNSSLWTNIMVKDGYQLPTGGRIIGSSLLASPTLVQQNPDIVQKFVNAFTEASIWVTAHNDTQILNAAYQDPTMQLGGNESSFLPDVQILKAGLNPGMLFITPADWTTTVYFSVASTPGIDGNENVTKLLSSYNAMVHPSFYDNATWCYNAAVW